MRDGACGAGTFRVQCGGSSEADLAGRFTRLSREEVLKFPAERPIGRAGVIEAVKILLVEDSRSIRVENERTLGKAGYEVICAEDGEEALRRARDERPDLILLDLLLPRISGLEVLRRLKRGAETADIPVVVVSGLSEKTRTT